MHCRIDYDHCYEYALPFGQVDKITNVMWSIVHPRSLLCPRRALLSAFCLHGILALAARGALAEAAARQPTLVDFALCRNHVTQVVHVDANGVTIPARGHLCIRAVLEARGSKLQL